MPTFGAKHGRMNFSTDILPLIREEITRVATSAYDDGGSSLYDAIVPKSRDEATLNRMYDDAVSALLTRTSDICVYSKDGDEDVLSFQVLDTDPDTLPLAAQEIGRFITLNVVGAWLQERYTARSEEYVARGQAALDKAVKILKTRRRPART